MGKFRDKAFDCIKEETISKEDMVQACLNYMGEDEIEDMLWSNFNIDLDEENEESDEE